MNKNLFDNQTKEEIFDRIDSLTENSQKLWGKMNVAQMIVHCQVAFKIALEEIKIKRMFMGILFGKFILNKILSEKPIKKNAPTNKEFIITGEKNLMIEREILKKYIDLFIEKNPKYYQGKVHPFFGKMTSEEWGILQYKHLDHHLKQFNS